MHAASSYSLQPSLGIFLSGSQTTFHLRMAQHALGELFTA
jgi:hypothetical protein